MKSFNKSKYFIKKFGKTQENDFYIFSYFPIVKAQRNSEINRIINKKKLKKLILPSSFQVVDHQKVQGPRVGIVYGNNFNFLKLIYVCNLKGTNVKFKTKWYAYNLVKELKFYENALSLSIAVNTTLQKTLLRIYAYIKYTKN